MRVSGLENYVGNDNTLNSLGYRVSSLETSFPAGCNTIMQAVTAKGVTPASNSPIDISTAISNISSGIDIGSFYSFSDEELEAKYAALILFRIETNRCVIAIVHIPTSNDITVSDVSPSNHNYCNIYNFPNSSEYPLSPTINLRFSSGNPPTLRLQITTSGDYSFRGLPGQGSLDSMGRTTFTITESYQTFYTCNYNGTICLVIFTY